jgi:hypothetical protein
LEDMMGHTLAASTEVAGHDTISLLSPLVMAPPKRYLCHAVEAAHV